MLVAVLLGAWFVPAWAAPGDLDRTFSGDGKLSENFGANDSGTALLIQADGRILAVGNQQVGAYGAVAARYDSAGALDPSFSGDGKLTIDGISGAAAALQRDGKIVVGGQVIAPSGASSGDFALARLNPDGSPDSSFDGDGRVVTDFSETFPGGGSSDPFVSVSALAVQTDGKIVAGGSGSGNRHLARYNPDGSLDSSFSEDGKQKTEFGSAADTTAVVVRPDGDLLTLGEGGLARYNADGFLDTGFSGDGKQSVGRGATDDLAVQDDGRIVTVGGRSVARLSAGGTPDPTFSADGFAMTSGQASASLCRARGRSSWGEPVAVRGCWSPGSGATAHPTGRSPATASRPPASPAPWV